VIFQDLLNSKVIFQDLLNKSEVISPSPLESPALHLSSHTASLVRDIVLIFGGIGCDGYSDKVHVLPVGEKEDIKHHLHWSTVTTSGPSPSPRLGHTAIVVGDDFFGSEGVENNGKKKGLL